MDEWRQYYPVEGPAVSQQQQQRGPGPGGGIGSLDEVEDMVEIVIGQVRTRYPACYVLVCDTDSVTNGPAFQQLAASEGGKTLPLFFNLPQDLFTNAYILFCFIFLFFRDVDDAPFIAATFECPYKSTHGLDPEFEPFRRLSSSRRVIFVSKQFEPTAAAAAHSHCSKFYSGGHC